MRTPIAAGSYYPSDKTKLSQIKSQLLQSKEMDFNSISSLYVPNGRMDDFQEMYIRAYSTLTKVPETTTFVILSGNKMKRGEPVAISNLDWFTPLGRVSYDKDLGESIKNHSSFAEFDNTAHEFETSIEIQLPFIQSLVSRPKMVALSFSISDPSVVTDIVDSIETSASILNREVILIGASQFIHSQSHEEAEEKTRKFVQILTEGIEEYNKNQKSFINLFLQDERVVNPAVFLIPFIYSMRQGFIPRVLSEKIVKTGVKDETDSYLSIAYVK